MSSSWNAEVKAVSAEIWDAIGRARLGYEFTQAELLLLAEGADGEPIDTDALHRINDKLRGLVEQRRLPS